MKNAEVGANLKKAEKNNQKQRNHEEISPVFNEITERFSLLFVGGNIVNRRKLKRQVVDALHFVQPVF